MTDPVPPPPPDPRQRWRITFARRADPTGRSHRELATDWLDRLAATGLPLATGGRGRQPLSFAAALPAGIAAERELADVVLTRRLPLVEVRPVLEGARPDGIEIRDLHDVWLGDPPLAAAVRGADYRVTLPDEGPARDELAHACADVLDAAALPWQRARGSGTATIDLRPLVVALDVEGDGEVEGSADALLRIRARIHPERGSGRPEEIVAALAGRLGRPIVIGAVVRERLLLGEELSDDA